MAFEEQRLGQLIENVLGCADVAVGTDPNTPENETLCIFQLDDISGIRYRMSKALVLLMQKKSTIGYC